MKPERNSGDLVGDSFDAEPNTLDSLVLIHPMEQDNLHRLCSCDWFTASERPHSVLAKFTPSVVVVSDPEVNDCRIDLLWMSKYFSDPSTISNSTDRTTTLCWWLAVRSPAVDGDECQ